MRGHRVGCMRQHGVGTGWDNDCWNGVGCENDLKIIRVMIEHIGL